MCCSARINAGISVICDIYINKLDENNGGLACKCAEDIKIGGLVNSKVAKGYNRI